MSEKWARFWAWFAVGVMVIGLVYCIIFGTVTALEVLNG